MSTIKSPLARVKEQFGSKDKLVDALVGLPEGVFERHNEDKDAFRKRLSSAANTKLLRMLEVGKAVKERFGSKEKLVDAILTQMNRGKDADYRGKLAQFSVSKLFARIGTLEKKGRAEKSASKKAGARA